MIYVLFLFMQMVDDREERNREVLDLVIEVGVALVEGVKAEIALPEDERTRSQSELTLDFSRLSQALRQSIALDQALVREVRHRDLEIERDSWRQEAQAGRDHRKAELSSVIHPMVGPTRSRAFDLRLEAFLDREARDITLAYDDAAFGQAIGRIVHDLRLEPNWTLWEDEPWFEAAKQTYDTLARVPIVVFANFDHIEEYVPPPDSG
jgi:hypothetical protein